MIRTFGRIAAIAGGLLLTAAAALFAAAVYASNCEFESPTEGDL